MRIMREYFGADRTTVTYEDDITGIGGNVREFFIVATVGKGSAAPVVRTTVHFSHEEMAELFAEYRRHHTIEGSTRRVLLSGPAPKLTRRVWRAVARFFGC